jgi:hypothetical protein
VGRTRKNRSYCRRLQHNKVDCQSHHAGLAHRQQLHTVFLKHVPDAAQGLACALFIFDKREADVPIFIFAEADARPHSHFRVLQQLRRKLERAQVPVWLRNRIPDEHRRFGQRNISPQLVQA